jgi:undecaprenyl-diphosphatase
MRKCLALDDRWTQQMRLKPEQKVLWRIAAFLAHSGDSWYGLFVLFLVWLLTKGDWHTKSALLAIGILSLALIVFAIKLIVRRKRPTGEWGDFYRQHDPHSFPSGHAARMFLLVVLAIGLGPWGFALGVCIWAPLVALARVWMGLHYLLDILVGILIGVAWGIVMLLLIPYLLHLFPFIF